MKDESRPDQPSAPKTPAPKTTASRPTSFFSSVDASLLGLGSQMLSEVVAGVLIGYGLDYLLGTKNTWIVVGSLAGVAVAMFSVIRVAMRPQTPRREPPGAKSDVGARGASGAEPKAGEQGGSRHD